MLHVGLESLFELSQIGLRLSVQELDVVQHVAFDEVLFLRVREFSSRKRVNRYCV